VRALCASTCACCLLLAALSSQVFGPGAAGARAPGGATDVVAPHVSAAGFAAHGDLAFISEGALWVLDGSNGKLTLVATSQQLPRHLEFSPNGKWLVYTTGAGRVWLARADGSGARQIAANGWGGWLPDGELLAGRSVWQVGAGGRLGLAGTVPPGLVAWSPDGDGYAFISSSLVISFTKPGSGVERLLLASGLGAQHTTWYEAPVSFSEQTGAEGNFIDRAYVLPGARGALFTVDPDMSASLAADGVNLYELTAPGASPLNLGVTVGQAVAIGPGGEFAFTNGPDRYEWLTKSVTVCMPGEEPCTPVPASPGMLSYDPAWSPNGRELAFVEAPVGEAVNFSQGTVAAWYAEHSLWVMQTANRTVAEVEGANGASAPVWSADGKSIMYVAGDGLWLVTAPSPGGQAKPVLVAAPLFQPGDWPNYYAQVAWSSQFAWSQATAG